jgi:hypothetical protein
VPVGVEVVGEELRDGVEEGEALGQVARGESGGDGGVVSQYLEIVDERVVVVTEGRGGGTGGEAGALAEGVAEEAEELLLALLLELLLELLPGWGDRDLVGDCGVEEMLGKVGTEEF